VSELSIQYRRSPLTLERVLDGGPRAGERAPDALVGVVDGPLGKAPDKGRIFDLHDPACFSLFLLVEGEGESAGAKNNGADARAALARFVEAVERLFPQALRVWWISDLANGETPLAGEGAPALGESYGRTRPAFYLVRPDGYIGARGRPGSDLNALLRHCETWYAATGFAQTPQG